MPTKVGIHALPSGVQQQQGVDADRSLPPGV
jgi:hypothetical protein